MHSTNRHYMKVESICNTIKNNTNINDVSINKSTYNYNKSNPAKELLKYSIVDSKDTKYTILKFTSNNQLLAECRLCVISNDVGYIHSIKVNESIQNNNIGTNIIEYSIKYLNPHDIYIYPTNNVIKHICRKYDFKPVDKPDNWYYLE